jgi:hypothetical protein
VNGTDLTYRWQRETSVGSDLYVDLIDGFSSLGLVSGSASRFLFIDFLNGSEAHGLRFRALVTSPCGGLVSNTSLLHVDYLRSIISSPHDAATCPSGQAWFDSVYGNEGFIFPIDTWQVAHQPTGPWTSVIEGPNLGPLGGVAFDAHMSHDFFGGTLDLWHLENFLMQWGSDRAYFRRVRGSACVEVASAPAELRVCVADMDDGSGSGWCDGGIGIEDLLYYLGTFDAGGPRADVDDGSGAGAPDGGVGIEDLLYYLGCFDAGC